MNALKTRLKDTPESERHYNYLAVIQSSGYGKTRAVLQLAQERDLIYICFRGEGSSGYPYKTPKSDKMLDHLWNAKYLGEAELTAGRWIEALISAFYDKAEEWKKTNSVKNYQQVLLDDMVKRYLYISS